MGVAEAIEIGTAGIKALADIWAKYKEGKVVLAEQDKVKIHAALMSARAITDELAPEVDAILAAAENR